MIFDPTYDLDFPKFVPCITMIKFRIRKNKLYMTSHMRAQDIWLGFPYDIFLLLFIFQVMGIMLDVELGDYHHECDVLRLYEDNFDESNLIRLKQLDTNQNTMKIDINKNEIFDKLNYFTGLIKIFPENFISLINKETIFWQNTLKVCYAYKLVKENKYKEAKNIIKSITNIHQDQFILWAKKYNYKFYNEWIENEN